MRKYRLSTLLLTAATFCICLGWSIDHAVHKRRIDTLLDGAMVFSEAFRFEQMAGALKREPEVIPGIIKAGLIRNILDLYQKSDSVDSLFAHTNSTDTASNMASATLQALECKSADEYFDMLRAEYGWDTIYVEFKDQATEEHRGLRAFIENSIVTVPED